MPFVRRNDTVLYYTVRPSYADAPAHPPFAFINSLGTDLRLWDGIVSRLGARASLLHDKRGHGLSDAPAGDYALDDHVDDLLAIMDDARITRAVLVGLSVGGMIAIRLAARAPDRVAGLVLCDTGHIIGDRALWNARIDAVRAGGMAVLTEAILERWFTPAFRERDDPGLSGCRNMLLGQHTNGYAGTCAAIREADLTDEARGITAPTLCLVGDADPATPPALMKALAALIPGARLATIAACGHIPPIEQPDALAAHLATFCDTL